MPVCHPKIPILFVEVLLRRGIFGRPMRICVDNRKRFQVNGFVEWDEKY